MLGFEAGEEGDPSACLSLMYEEGGGVVRAWWRLGDAGADEVVVRLVDASLGVDHFRARVEASEHFPFDVLDVSFSIDARERDGAAEALSLLMGARPSRTMDGPPVLGAVAAAPWKTALGQPLCIELLVSNRGGPLDGVDVELGGAALDGGLVRVAEVSSLEGTAVREGAVWRAPMRLPALVVSHPPDPPPVARLQLSVEPMKTGSALLTVRVIPRGAIDRTGASLVGRPVTVV